MPFSPCALTGADRAGIALAHMGRGRLLEDTSGHPPCLLDTTHTTYPLLYKTHTFVWDWNRQDCRAYSALKG